MEQLRLDFCGDHNSDLREETEGRTMYTFDFSQLEISSAGQYTSTADAVFYHSKALLFVCMIIIIMLVVRTDGLRK